MDEEEKHVTLVDIVMPAIADALPCICRGPMLDPGCPQGLYQDSAADAVAAAVIAAGWTPPTPGRDELRKQIRAAVVMDARHGPMSAADSESITDAVLPVVQPYVDAAERARALCDEAEVKGQGLQAIPELELAGNAYVGMASRIRAVLPPQP